MKLFVLAFLTGIGFKFGEFLIDFLFSLIPRKRRKTKFLIALTITSKKIGPLTTALSFYPRLEFSTQVTEKHVKLISEKFPGLKIWKNILKGGRT